MFTTPVSLEWQGDLQSPQSSFIRACAMVGTSQVTVTFAPLDSDEEIYLINFDCTPTPKAIEHSFQVFNIIVQAVDHYYYNIFKPKYWVYTASTESQAKLYQRIQQSIHNKRHGYQKINFEDLPPVILGRIRSTGIADFVSMRV
jgi:hypothetical protein